MTIDPSIFKAYDVRGIHPDQITADVAHRIGRAFVAYLGASRIAVGRDMRIAAPEIASAFIDGALAQGADVTDFGLIGTDMLYYGVARDGFDGGAEITASHNPKDYIGMKLVRAQALPLSGDSGIGEICDMVVHGTIPAPSTTSPGTRTEAALLDDYVDHVLSFIDVAVVNPFRLVLDAGSGMAGLMAPALFDRLPCTTTRLCFNVDGTFPIHEANPLIEANRRDIVEQVTVERADAGIAWDGDADRCFFIDGDGTFVAGDFITALLAEAFLRKTPGAKIVYDIRASLAVPDTVARFGGTALVNRVGHAFFKARMRAEDALFGGEVTGHYYFRDNFFADNGMIPALLLLELMSVRGESLSELLAPLRAKYCLSGEINTEMPGMDAVAMTLDRLVDRYADARISRLDGVSVDYGTWRFNVRPSNTEPLLRLNLEATTEQEMIARRDEVVTFLRNA